jgi:hypothetical protein
MAFHRLYACVKPTDIPFAQDCVGDQFLLRNGHVLRLLSETGETEGAAIDLAEFFEHIEENAEEFLNFSPDHPLEPGQLLHAYPPFCVKDTGKGYSLKACPAKEVILSHAEFAKEIADVANGDSITIEVTD